MFPALFVLWFEYTNKCFSSLLRKQQVATEYNRKQVLQHHFTEWQHWLRAEILKRELTVTKAETRMKINELLKAASQGKLCADGSSAISPLQDATPMINPPERNGEVSWIFFFFFCWYSYILYT